MSRRQVHAPADRVLVGPEAAASLRSTITTAARRPCPPPRRSGPRRASRPSPRSSRASRPPARARSPTRRASSGSPRRGSRCRCARRRRGSCPVAPAAATPGSARTRRSASSVKRAARRVVGVARAREARPRRSATRSATKPESTSSTLREAREQQAGAEHQHEREGHLRHDQVRRSTRAAPRAGRAAALLAEHGARVRAAARSRAAAARAGCRSRARAPARRARPSPSRRISFP